VPRLDAIAALWAVLGDSGTTEAMVPDRPLAIAAMDSSDGLANAVLQLCQASGVGARLTNISLDAPLVDWVGRDRALDWCLYGGEDFELVLCLPWAVAEALQARLGKGCAIVGETTPTLGVELYSDSSTRPLTLSFSQGFQHFQGP
jgi:thiamine-monophosphate kinase